ncbi:MAG TPA: LamG domain-containing protein, partial [Catalimonadaceae bacterium]|nr:LamG domain-containing protein [Catalimonadaceae bacterium]
MKTSRSTIQLRHDSQLNHHPALFGTEKWKFSFLLLMLFFLVLFLPGFLFAQSPVAHYPLDGNGNDVSGNSLNGTIVGSLSPTTDRFGNANSALNFSGSGQVDIGGNLTDQNFSVSMWLKPGTTQNQFADIIDNAHTGFQNWVIQQDNFETNRYVFGVHTSSGGIGVFFTLTADVWQHLVVVKSETAVSGYVNGVLIQTTPWTGTVNYVNPFLRLGNFVGGGRQWNGGMDEVKYFNTALSQSDVSVLFSDGRQPIAYYPFSGNANDAEGSLNGTVNGATLTTDRFGKPNSAYQFDGVNDAISFPSLPMNNIDNFTLMAWVNPSEFDPGNQFNRMIVSLGPGDKGYNYGMGNVSGSGAGNQLGGLYNFISWLPSGSFFANPNQWYHTAMVRENGVTKFYLNGVQAPNTFTATPNQMTTDFQIGGQAFDPTHFWKGGIDEVKIYNVALNASQVEKEFFSQADYGDSFGNAVLLDGANDHITIPNNAALSPSSVTVEAWVRPMGFTSTKIVNASRQYIVFKQNTQTSSFEGFAVQMIEGCKCFEVGVSSASGQNPIVNSPNNSIELGKSYHLALVANSTELKFYVNGVLQGTAPMGFELNYGTKPVFIGRSGENTFEGFFNGRVDEVRIWNTTRSQNEIQSTINSPLSGTETGLVGYWDMNRTGQGTGLVVENKATATGSALNGTTGGSVTTPVFTLGSTMALHKPGSGNALSFNGSNQQVNSTQVASTPNNFTMEAWVNPGSSTTLHGQSTGGAGGQFGNNQFVVFPLHGVALGSGSENAGAGFSVGTNGICVYEHGDSYIPVLLSWSGTISGCTHVSIVYTNKQPSLYVNGILVATGLTSQRTNVFASSSEIGGGAYGHFNGSIDEVRIWNSSLTQSEIRDRMCRKITNGDALFS